MVPQPHHVLSLLISPWPSDTAENSAVSTARAFTLRGVERGHTSLGTVVRVATGPVVNFSWTLQSSLSHAVSSSLTEPQCSVYIKFTDCLSLKRELLARLRERLPIFKRLCVYFEREREQEHGRSRERKGKRIPSRLRAQGSISGL